MAIGEGGCETITKGLEARMTLTKCQVSILKKFGLKDRRRKRIGIWRAAGIKLRVALLERQISVLTDDPKDYRSGVNAFFSRQERAYRKERRHLAMERILPFPPAT